MALVIGTSGADELTGIGLDEDTIKGLGGDDIISGLGGNDFLVGGTGDDSMMGGTGADLLWGGFGADTLVGGDDNDTLRGGPGSDSLVGGGGDDLYIETLLRNSSTGTLSLPGSIVEDVGGGNDTLEVHLAPQRLTLAASDGGVTLSRVGSATNPIVGSWVATNHDEVGGTFVITFLDNGTYMIAEDGDPEVNPAGMDGIERGAYTWDPATDAFSRGKIFTDTNGEWGLSHATVEQVTVDGDSLTIFSEDGPFTVERVKSDSNPLIGAWTASNSGEARSTMVLTFLDDEAGTFVLAEDGDSSKATGDPSGKDGMELGTYFWNSETNALTIDIDTAEGGVNTNGQWGFSHSDGGFKATPGYLPVSPFAVVLQANMDNLDLRNTGTLRLDGTGNELANVMFGNEGVNRFMGGAGDDSINGYGGNDVLEGGDGGDTASGGAGNDLVGGDDGEGFGDDLLYGDEGNDTVAGDEGSDTLYGGSGNDYLEGDAGLPADAGDDYLSGEDGNDKLFGRGGNDTLDGGAGQDTMTGGAGNDVYVVSQATDVVVEKSGEGVDTIQSIVTRTLISHQENLVLIGEDAVNGTGNSVDNVIDGNGAINILDGKSGNDTIAGAEGNDTLFGGSGDDSIDGGDGDDSMIGGSGSDTYFVDSTENDIVVEELGDSGVDTIITNGSINMADHGHVENLHWLNGGGGGFCQGNALDNVMSVDSGAGTLTMDGQGGTDTLTFEGRVSAVIVDLDAGKATTDAAVNIVDTVNNIENATGGLGNDTLNGDSIANVLDGSAGADSMAGGFGGDTYIVDDENDVIEEVENVDLLVLPGDPGHGAALVDLIDTVRAAVSYSLANFDYVENMVLTGNALNATGNAENNLITGNGLANTLDGLSGADTLLGGGGADRLVWRPELSPGIYNGGAGTDTLVVGGDGDNLDLTSPFVPKSALVSIEKVDMRGETGNDLKVSARDILDMSSTDKLTVQGDEGDQVFANGFRKLANSGGMQQFSATVSGKTAILLVETDVAVFT